MTDDHSRRHDGRNMKVNAPVFIRTMGAVNCGNSEQATQVTNADSSSRLVVVAEHL